MRNGWAAALAVLGMVVMVAAVAAVLQVQLDTTSPEGANVDISEELFQHGGSENDAQNVGNDNSVSTWEEDGSLGEVEPRDAVVDAPPSPLASSQNWRFGSYNQDGIQESWAYEADGEVSSLAVTVLEDIKASNAALVESGYLDLREAAWGCACELPDRQGSLAVTVMKPSGESAGQSDDAAHVRIVLYSASKLQEALDAQ